MSAVHDREQQRPRYRRTTITAIVLGVCFALVGHDALMAGGGHVATPSGGEPRAHHDHAGPDRGHGEIHGDDHRRDGAGDDPAEPCSTARQAAARGKPDLQPDDLEHDLRAVDLPIVASPPVSPATPRPLPAATRRALLQVFLN